MSLDATTNSSFQLRLVREVERALDLEEADRNLPGLHCLSTVRAPICRPIGSSVLLLAGTIHNLIAFETHLPLVTPLDLYCIASDRLSTILDALGQADGGTRARNAVPASAWPCLGLCPRA